MSFIKLTYQHWLYMHISIIQFVYYGQIKYFHCHCHCQINQMLPNLITAKVLLQLVMPFTDTLYMLHNHKSYHTNMSYHISYKH